MYGILLAVIICAGTALIGGHTLEDSFIKGAKVLFFWNLVVSVMTITLAIASMSSIMRAIRSGTLQIIKNPQNLSIADVIKGAKKSIKRNVALAIIIAVGCYLIMTSGKPGISFSEFNTFKLLFGAILFLVGITIRQVIFYKEHNYPTVRENSADD